MRPRPRHLPALLTGLAVLVAAILQTGTALSGGSVHTDRSVTSMILDRSVGYAVYLPDGHDTDNRRYPVIYLMHGGGTGAPADWFTLAGIDTLIDRLIDSGAMPPVIAIAPDGRRDAENAVATYFMNDADGEHDWETMFLEEFMPLMEARYPALATTGARGILGISMGGHAALAYTLRDPDLFAGAVSLSGAFRTPSQIAALSQPAYERRYGKVWGTGLEGSARLNDAWARSDIIRIVDAADPVSFRRVPRIYVDTGADDPFFEGNAALHVRLKSAGIRHRFMVREGGHDWPYWRSGLEDALLHLGRVFIRDYGE